MSVNVDNFYNSSGNYTGDVRTGFDDLFDVQTFLGIFDLKTGCMIIAAICLVHPLVYGCTFFMPMSYLLITIWIMLALFFVANVVLFYGLINNDAGLIAVWIWYSLAFVVIMLLLMFLLALFFTTKKQRAKIGLVILGMIWYMLTVYFILVVISHRKTIVDAAAKTISQDSLETSTLPNYIDSNNTSRSPDLLPDDPDAAEKAMPTDTAKPTNTAKPTETTMPTEATTPTTGSLEPASEHEGDIAEKAAETVSEENSETR